MQCGHTGKKRLWGLVNRSGQAVGLLAELMIFRAADMAVLDTFYFPFPLQAGVRTGWDKAFCAVEVLFCKIMCRHFRFLW